MGVDTDGIISANIDREDIIQAVINLFDKNAKAYIEDSNYYENDFQGRINFEYENENRSIFICKTCDVAEDTEFDKVLHTNFILGCYGYSIEIMQKLVGYFGGYVDDNDCDSIGYYKIDKDGTIHEPVLEVTWNDIYEKFGRVVKIKR